ncbi:hemophore-related protein [Mycobacterium sp. ML4]
MRLSFIGMGAAAGAIAMSLGLGAGVASADPLDGVVNTTCSYPQVLAALNATNPGAAAQLTSSPIALSYLQRFLASPPPQRAQMAAQIQAMPGASQYIGVVETVAGVCNSY